MSRYEIVQPIGEDERKVALAFIEDALKPAGEDFVLTELGRLRALTVSRDIGQDLAVVFAVYTDELMRYPADAVREVLRGWRGKFWPACAELMEQLDCLVAPRKALLEAFMRDYCEPEPTVDLEPYGEDRERVAAELLAKYGIKLDEHGHKLQPDPITKADREQMARELAEHRAKWAAATGAAE